MAQTSYDRDQGLAFAGMKADARFDEVVSYQAEGAIAFGLGVVRGTDKERQVIVPNGTTTGMAMQGLALYTHKEPVAGAARYEDKEMVSVLRKGRVWVPVVGTITTADAPRIIDTGTDAGKFTAATTDSTAIAGLQFESSYDATTSDLALALLDVNLPQQHCNNDDE